MISKHVLPQGNRLDARSTTLFDGTHVANTWELAQLVGTNEPALELKFLLSPDEQNEAHTVLELVAKMGADELSGHVGRVLCTSDHQPVYTPWVESADYMHFFARYLHTRRPALWALTHLRWRAKQMEWFGLTQATLISAN